VITLASAHQSKKGNAMNTSRLPPNPLAGPAISDESPRPVQSATPETNTGSLGHGMFAGEEEGGHEYEKRMNAEPLTSTAGPKYAGGMPSNADLGPKRTERRAFDFGDSLR